MELEVYIDTNYRKFVLGKLYSSFSMLHMDLIKINLTSNYIEIGQSEIEEKIKFRDIYGVDYSRRFLSFFNNITIIFKNKNHMKLRIYPLNKDKSIKILYFLKMHKVNLTKDAISFLK